MKSTQPSLIALAIYEPSVLFHLGRWIKCGMEGRLAHQEKCIDLKSLNGTQKQLHLKLRKIDHLVTSVGGRMTDNDQ